jgi:putative membrane protein
MLSDADRAQIEQAVQAAEARTSGEIYCVVAEQSSDYRETVLAWAAGVALLAPALLLAGGIEVSVPDALGGWTAAQVGAAAERTARDALLGAMLLQGLLFVVTAVVVAIPAVRLMVTPRGVKRDKVRRRAAEQFLAKNLHLTRARTGVLIFVSAEEHMAELIADEGISAKVEPSAWEPAMRLLIDGLKRDRPGDGFAGAIAACADILEPHFPANALDNPDELPNTVVELPKE